MKEGDSMEQNIDAIYSSAGFTGNLTLGMRPAVLVVDFQLGFTDPDQSPLAGDFSTEIERTARILDQARKGNVPVFYTAIGYATEEETGLWGRKVPSLKNSIIGSALTEIDPRLKRRPDEIVIIKKYASAFAGTPLASLLSAQKVDTLLVTGTTTSGCIRASVVDALQNGFTPFVVTDAVCDRAAGPHESNLLDMKSKYAESMTTDQAVQYLKKFGSL
jgi:nicotinamidase-related amidase